MTAPKDITGPEDLASTVRNATDPLEAYPNYGTSANPPGVDTARPEEMSELLDERSPDASTFAVACERYIADHPIQSLAVAAGAGAAAAVGMMLLVGAIRDRRW